MNNELQVFIKQNNVLLKILLSDITWIESDGNYCKINTLNNKYVIKRSLVKLLEILPNELFMRVHMRYIVAINSIEQIDLSANQINVNNNKISIGPRFRAEILSKLNIL